MEEIIFSIKPDKKYIYIVMIINLLAFFGVAIVVSWLSNVLLISRFFNLAYWVSLLLFILIMFNIIRVYLDTNATSYTLKDGTFILQEGFFHIRKDNIELFRIKDVSISQPFIYRFFNMSNIILHTSDHSSPTIKMYGIVDADKYLNDLRIAMNEVVKPTIIETL